MFETKSRGARFGVFEADLELHELRKHGARIKLSEQPFQALALLLEHAGEVVRRETFRDVLWPNEPWGEHDQRLNRIINKIREALCDSAETPRFLETIPRVGYRLMVNVDRFGEVGPREVTQVVSSPPVPFTPLTPEALPVPPLKAKYLKQPWVIVGCALITSVVGAGLSNRISPKLSGNVKLAEPAPLTTYVGSELYPTLSPDGKQVVFSWDGESSTAFHIYTARVAGGGAHRITNEAQSDGSPVWSPNGEEIAFLRSSSPGMTELWVVHADGNGARKLREIRSTVTHQSMAWTEDGKWVIVSQRSPQNGIPALYRVSTRDGGEQQITFVTSGQSTGDMNPAFSPDGKRLAFTRSTSPAWRDVFVFTLSRDQLPAGEPVRLTDARTLIHHVTWAPDGHSIVFSAATTVSAPHHLFRVDAPTNGSSGEVSELGVEGDHPTVAGAPAKLAFVRTNIEQSSIWRLGRDSAGQKQSRMLSSTRRDFTTDLSPDGMHIVFSSIRSGQTEIWTSQTDGSNLRKLTSLGGSSPRWSPDGKRIAFVSNHLGEPDVYVLSLDGQPAKRLTTAAAANFNPSWSRDGRFIYFCSNRTDRHQIWKVPSEGGDPVQITRHGGRYAVETFDAKSIYYTSAEIPAEVWVTSVNGGDEKLVIPKSVGYSSIALARDGLYYLSSSKGSTQVEFYRFADKTTRTLTSVDRPVHPFLSSSCDGRSVLYTQVDRHDTDLMLIDPYR